MCIEFVTSLRVELRCQICSDSWRQSPTSCEFNIHCRHDTTRQLLSRVGCVYWALDCYSNVTNLHNASQVGEYIMTAIRDLNAANILKYVLKQTARIDPKPHTFWDATGEVVWSEQHSDMESSEACKWQQVYTQLLEINTTASIHMHSTNSLNIITHNKPEKHSCTAIIYWIWQTVNQKKQASNTVHFIQK